MSKMTAIMNTHSAAVSFLRQASYQSYKFHSIKKFHYIYVIYKHQFPTSPTSLLKTKSRVKQRHHRGIPHVQRRNSRFSFRTSIQRVLPRTTLIHEVVTNEIGDDIRVQGTLLAAKKTVAVGWQERELRCKPPVEATTKFDSGVCALSEVKAELTNRVSCCCREMS